ncbi:hypothetical protein V0288_15845 [Pannus brasiliensis CCIBt3594]|uniref:Uncharacterized protein n=1 Tax=Pannus brasiliensis CCIBt3594 TaxID=1427578 RepID=A0AAW9QP02_9CHRO
MAESFNLQFQNLTNRELIDLALESLGDDREAIRHAALVEHCNRTKESPEALHAPAKNL